jgi:hypothetical protein
MGCLLRITPAVERPACRPLHDERVLATKLDRARPVVLRQIGLPLPVVWVTRPREGTRQRRLPGRPGGHRRSPARWPRPPPAPWAVPCPAGTCASGKRRPAAAAWRGGRDLRRRGRRGARIPGPGGADGPAVRAGPVHRRRHVPQRRPGPAAPGRASRTPRANRQPGQDPRLPHRTRRDPCRPAGGPRRPSGRRRPPTTTRRTRPPPGSTRKWRCPRAATPPRSANGPRTSSPSTGSPPR